MTQEQQRFIDFIKDGALLAQKEQKVLASLTMAQAILESGWGKSGLSQKSNNYFGMKAAGAKNRYWDGSYDEYSTKEFIGGKEITVVAKFRKYKNVSDSINDHALLFVTLPRYSNLIGETDYKKACTNVRLDGYATDPGYTPKLIGIIETYNLSSYDKKTTSSAINQTDSNKTTSVKDTTIKEGKTVKIKNTAKTYSTGQIIPDWVKTKTYTVQQSSTTKSLLKEITSWVNNEDLSIV